jgi:ribosomal-protein-alanine N-acetyltransferase
MNKLRHDSEQFIQFKVRNCTTKEIPAVMNINEATLPENYPIFFYEQILERYPESFLLAYSEEDPKIIIGYIMWRVEKGPSSFGLNYVKKGHLVSLAVLNKYRRIGVASTLLANSMQNVQKYSVSEYVLEVRVSNAGANKLYETKLGYEKIRILGHYYRDGEDAFNMAHKYDPNNEYKRGMHSMSDKEIIKFYKKKKQKFLCYRCPNCEKLLIKGLNYSFLGSINPKNPTKEKCAYCGTELSLYEISQGRWDV